jgi:hypothetical protein
MRLAACGAPIAMKRRTVELVNKVKTLLIVEQLRWKTRVLFPYSRTPDIWTLVKSTILRRSNFQIEVTQITSDFESATCCCAYIHVASIKFTFKRPNYFSETG